MNVRIDHIVLAVTDLRNASQRLQGLLGVSVSGGGRHHGTGTENVIMPLGESFLELVTVVDYTAAATNPFGRLVAAGTRQGRSVLAAWVVPGRPETPRLGPLSHQKLSRAGVSVELFGPDEAVLRPDLPIWLLRPAEQANPGLAGGVSNTWAITAMTLEVPAEHVPPARGEPAALPPGETAITVNRTSGPARIADLTLSSPADANVVLTESLWDDE